MTRPSEHRRLLRLPVLAALVLALSSGATVGTGAVAAPPAAAAPPAEVALPAAAAPPAAAAAAPAAAVATVHVVSPGDTLNALARRYRLSSMQLMLWNDLRPPFTLHPDGVLRVTRPAPGPRPAFSATVARVSAAELGSSYRAGCPVGPGSLRVVTLPHTTFDGGWASGRIVVHADLADETVRAFARLYAQRVPVARMVPVSAYGGSDDRSMAANNTSAFNCRLTTSGTRWSEHSYGRAIDVNPVQNPYVSGGTVLPPAGAGFTDRSRYRLGMLHLGGGVGAFTAEGLYWGGAWTSPKDYQHFSSTNR